MAINRKIAALTFAAAAAVAPIGMSQHAALAAPPVSANCSGGTLGFATTPIGMGSAPVSGEFHGNLTGCPITAFRGNFTGTASCWDTQVNINGQLTWADGKVSAVAGPWHVPGGMAPPAVTNTVTIVSGPGSGKSLTVQEAGIDAGSVAGPCMAGAARNLTVQIVSATI